MLKFILRRILIMIPTVLIISAIVFWVIQLPPGDYMTTYISSMEASGESFTMETIEQMRKDYGLDQPWYVQYYKWITNILFKGDFGYSFMYSRPVTYLVAERMPTTLAVSITTMLFTYIVSIPIGIYSAVKQLSLIHI